MSIKIYSEEAAAPEPDDELSKNTKLKWQLADQLRDLFVDSTASEEERLFQFLDMMNHVAWKFGGYVVNNSKEYRRIKTYLEKEKTKAQNAVIDMSLEKAAAKR